MLSDIIEDMTMKDERIRRGLTQVELAKLSDIKQPLISDYESGAKPIENMTLGTAVKLARALKVPIEKLLD